MRGDAILFIRWGEVNDCHAVEDGGVWKVTLYGEIVKDLEFSNRIKAIKWLRKYYDKKYGGKK